MFTPYLIQKYTSDKLTEIEKSSKIGLRLLGDFWRAIFEKSSKSGTQEKYYNDENKFQPRQEANQPLKIWPEPYPKLKRPTLHSLHAKPRQIV